MKTLTHTIITIVALSLLAVGVVSAGNTSDEEIQAAVDVQVKKAKTEIVPVLAQAQTSQPIAPSPAPSPTPAVPTPPALPSSAPVDLVSNDLFRGLSFGSRSGSAGTVLVIPSEQTTTEDLLTINEDMNVMSRIFETNLEQDRIATARSSIFISRGDVILPLLGGGRSEIQSMYLQGFGALFLLKVDFLLAPPPDVEEAEQETQKAEEGDPVWREVRQQIYEPEKVDRRRKTDRQEEKYDAEKVENLKTTLIKTLKHAANIRSLKPDESVVLTVVGKGDVTGTTITNARVLHGENQIIVQERTAGGKMVTKMVTGPSIEDIGLSSPAVLVIRTKKSDIDEFAKGDLDLEKFRQRVQLLTYPLLGGANGGDRDLFDDYYNRSRSRSRNMR